MVGPPQSPADLSRTLVDLERKEVHWAAIFQGVKALVRNNDLNDETRRCIKAWLKAADATLHQPLLALTVGGHAAVGSVQQRPRPSTRMRPLGRAFAYPCLRLAHLCDNMHTRPRYLTR